MSPLPWKLREPFFHLRGGGGGYFLPHRRSNRRRSNLAQPLILFATLFEDFNRESDELPPLVPIEEELSRSEEQKELGHGDSTSSRPSRQLRSRTVARSIKGDKTVRFQ